MNNTLHSMCQSCGLPFDAEHEHFRAKEKDGTKSIYCSFCYKDGAFINPNATLEEIAELGVPHLGKKIGEEAARKELTQLLASLQRWK